MRLDLSTQHSWPDNAPLDTIPLARNHSRSGVQQGWLLLLPLDTIPLARNHSRSGVQQGWLLLLPLDTIPLARNHSKSVVCRRHGCTLFIIKTYTELTLLIKPVMIIIYIGKGL